MQVCSFHNFKTACEMHGSTGSEWYSTGTVWIALVTTQRAKVAKMNKPTNKKRGGKDF